MHSAQLPDVQPGRRVCQVQGRVAVSGVGCRRVCAQAALCRSCVASRAVCDLRGSVPNAGGCSVYRSPVGVCLQASPDSQRMPAWRWAARLRWQGTQPCAAGAFTASLPAPCLLPYSPRRSTRCSARAHTVRCVRPAGSARCARCTGIPPFQRAVQEGGMSRRACSPARRAAACHCTNPRLQELPAKRREPAGGAKLTAGASSARRGATPACGAGARDAAASITAIACGRPSDRGR